MAAMAHSLSIDPHSEDKPRERDVDEAIASLAERQHGLIARRQLLALGLGPKAIAYRTRRFRLHAVYRGVYAVGHARLDKHARWMAAVLAGGSGAALSHGSAAALWLIGSDPAARAHVVTPRGQHPREGIRFHRARLPDDEKTRRDGIAVTTVPRTLFDLATSVRPRQLERAFNEAEIQRLWDTLSLEHLLVRYPRRPGSRAIRGLLDARMAGSKVTRSELEVMFLEFVDNAGFPVPETNQWIEGFLVDAVWRVRRLTVELDGYGTHSTRAAFEDDRERSRALQATGWRCIPVTWRQLRHAPQAVARDLHRALAAPAR